MRTWRKLLPAGATPRTFIEIGAVGEKQLEVRRAVIAAEFWQPPGFSGTEPAYIDTKESCNEVAGVQENRRCL